MRYLAVHALFFAFFSSLLQVHAELPVNGTYRIENVGTNKYLDLRRGSPAEGTQVIGFKLDSSDNAMQWVCIRKYQHLSIFRNVRSKTYIDAPQEVSDGNVIGSVNPGIFTVWEKDNSETYQINLPNEGLSFSLHGNVSFDRVVLKANNANDRNQLWRFHKI